jgi:D-alanyl-D-alanine carboxypeptidase
MRLLALAALASVSLLGCSERASREAAPSIAVPPSVVLAAALPDEAPPEHATPPKASRCTRAAEASAPTDASDLLFYVNRTHAIPSEFPVSSTSIWTPCAAEPQPSKAAHDLVCLPAAYTFRNREALRSVAFESDAPAEPTTTHDGLSVGRHGKVGFRALFDEAKSHGFDLYVRSGFRAYSTQSATFSMWVAQELAQGRSREDALRKVTGFSARAGHSEHQLGTTVDLVYRAENGVVYDGWDPSTIAASPAMTWVRANAHRFGVVLSYDEDRVDVTQYVYEPWHWRFVGVAAADAMHECSLSTEELLQARYGEPPPPPFSPRGSSRSARR